MIYCKNCGNQMPDGTLFCPKCGTKVGQNKPVPAPESGKKIKKKKPIYKRWWFWVIIVIVIIGFIPSGGDSEDTGAETGGDTNISTTTGSGGEDTSVKTVYNVGDALMDGDTKIVYVASGEYIEENEYSQPDDGYKYIFLRFAYINTSSKTDDSISVYDFECYADGYATEMYYGGEEELSATLSAGRSTTGCVYFSVPVNATEIEIEYTANYFSSKKIRFIYEGEKDSGYVLEPNTAPTAGAYSTGAVVESSQLKITYISCEDYESDNMFVQPKEGYKYISCSFEFENVGSHDEHVTAYDFDCYADGLSCNGVYIRDDSLSATLSTGRKTKGSVTFEVPIDADVIEVEYLSNYWTSNRVVFTVK